MAAIRFVLVFFGLLAISGTMFAATCAYDSYLASCKACSFDADGKMDSQCADQYQEAGITCIGTNHPFAAAQYAQDKCPGMEECISRLKNCKAEYSITYTDKAGCAEGEGGIIANQCFYWADKCVEEEAAKCEKDVSVCPGSEFIIGAVLLSLLISSRK